MEYIVLLWNTDQFLYPSGWRRSKAATNQDPSAGKGDRFMCSESADEIFFKCSGPVVPAQLRARYIVLS